MQALLKISRKNPHDYYLLAVVTQGLIIETKRRTMKSGLDKNQRPAQEFISIFASLDVQCNFSEHDAVV